MRGGDGKEETSAKEYYEVPAVSSGGLSSLSTLSSGSRVKGPLKLALGPAGGSFFPLDPTHRGVGGV